MNTPNAKAGMLMLRITQCPDPMMWYANHVGECVAFIGAWHDAWKSLEDSGLLNIVKFADAELVLVSGDDVTPATGQTINQPSALKPLERERFEHWFSSQGKWPKAVERDGDSYKLMGAYQAWNAWEACATYTLNQVTEDEKS